MLKCWTTSCFSVNVDLGPFSTVPSYNPFHHVYLYSIPLVSDYFVLFYISTNNFLTPDCSGSTTHSVPAAHLSSDNFVSLASDADLVNPNDVQAGTILVCDTFTLRLISIKGALPIDPTKKVEAFGCDSNQMLLWHYISTARLNFYYIKLYMYNFKLIIIKIISIY